jgi:branched-chain amino acid aminotransferase
VDVVWLNGELVAAEEAGISPYSAAVRYSHVVFDGFRAFVSPEEGVARLLGARLHLERFRRSCELLGLRLGPADDELHEAIRTVLRTQLPEATCAVRLFAWAAGTSFVDEGDAVVAVFLLPLEGYAPDRPLRVCLSRYVRPADADLPRDLKTPAQYVLARLAVMEARERGFDDALFVNEHGRVSEASRATLLVLRGSTVVTPPTSEGVLPGVTRELVRRMCGAAGLAWQETPLERGEVLDAEGAFLCSSSLGLAPLEQVEQRSLPTATAAARALARVFDDATEGRLSDLDDLVEVVELAPVRD